MITPIILGAIFGILLYLNGRKKTVFKGKIIDKYEGLHGFTYFIIAIDKGTAWTVKCSNEDFFKYRIGKYYEFKIYDVI